MSNIFIYEQGWLVEKPEMVKPFDWVSYNNPGKFGRQETIDYGNCIRYENHLQTLRRFKYDYPDPKKEMELGKDFEVMDTNKWYYCKCEQCGWEGSSEHCGGGHQIADTGDYHDAVCPKCYSARLDGQPLIDVPQYEGTIAIPITQRTYSEQDLLDVWDAAWKRSEDFVLTPISSSRFPSKKEFFKQKFGIEIK